MLRTEKKPKVVQIPSRVWGKVEIVDGLVEKDPNAAAALFDRLGPAVNRRVWRLLGADAEHDDVVHQVFVNILTSIKKLKDPNMLDDWVTGVTINTVRRELRDRKYRRILVPADSPGNDVTSRDDLDQQMLVNRVFRVLKSMKADDHVVFVLRFIEGSTLGEVASAGNYSLATAKRRINSAKKAFLKRATKDPVLASFIEGIENA